MHAFRTFVAFCDRHGSVPGFAGVCSAQLLDRGQEAKGLMLFLCLLLDEMSGMHAKARQRNIWQGTDCIGSKHAEHRGLIWSEHD
mmetsp:Transcript_89311/g.239279  ORF Transcript_89311/g.239279 Transcript_89311/m.239279 type:complete len:85 (+) Transcript_89311:139-393(+)